MNRVRAILSILVLVCACSSANMVNTSSSPVELSLAKTDIVAGESITLSFKNVSGEELIYGDPRCGLSLEGLRDTDNSWVTVTPANPVCTFQGRALAPGTSDSVTFLTDATLPTNRYRLRMPSPEPSTSTTAAETVYSPLFTIRAAGSPSPF